MTDDDGWEHTFDRYGGHHSSWGDIEKGSFMSFSHEPDDQEMAAKWFEDDVLSTIDLLPDANTPTHVFWFNTEPWWKRTLRRLHLIRRPKPFDWNAAAGG